MTVIVPIFICVVLPVAIVLIISLVRVNSDNKRTQVIIKAIEANNEIDADRIAESLRKPHKSAREILNQRLLLGCIFSLIGIFLGITGLSAWFDGHTFGEDPVTVPIMFGGISFAVGLSYLIVFWVTRKQIDDK